MRSPLLAADVEFSAIVDPNTELAHQRVADLQKGKFADKWSKTKVFPDYRDLLNSPVNTFQARQHEDRAFLLLTHNHLGKSLDLRNLFMTKCHNYCNQ